MSVRAAAAALAALCLIAAPAARAADPPSAADLEAELVCPTCKTTLDQSNAPVAQRMKEFIRERIAAGDSADEIKDALVAQFGPRVLANPTTSGFDLLAWVLPLSVVAAGAVAVGVLVRRWSRRRPRPGAEEPLDAELERRLDDELARFEG